MSVDDEEDDGSPVPRTVGRQPSRPVSRTDAERLARATAEEQRLMERERQIHGMELAFAEWFGRDGDGGKMAGMVSKLADHDRSIESHEGQITKLTEFKGRLVWLGGLALTVGGVIAAIAAKVIDHVLK